MPKRDRIWKHLGIAFAATLTLYLIGFSWVEHRRTRLGPWAVTFVKEPGSAPLIQIDHTALQVTNVQIRFNTGTDAAPTNARVDFVAGREVPFPVPFGECVFMDPLFLPGTVTLELFGHRVQMLPRTLMIDGLEHGWKSDSIIDIHASP
jgi:hypothetical protein